MSDVDWDKDGFNIPSHVKRKDDRWEGEDEDDDIKDNWDDDDEEEARSESSETKVDVVAPKKKKPLAVIIAEKEEKKRRELEEKKKKELEEKASRAPKTQEELLQERLEQQRLQEESDLLLAKEAFGVSDQKAERTSLDMNLSSKEDFDTFKRNLVIKLQSVEKSPHYVSFLETAFREICVTLDPDDIKRISSNLNALFNEKIKAQKTTKAKKKGTKGAAIKIERSDMDLAADDYGDDLDDFL
ncbi:eukaryotic translation initiation factor 3 subunit J-like protein [Dinothrombium tinctorium]|uniref:Eukaryotic translation initiation factor 3 subunit J n=1 Tax=Dinothrombium tinctorium TaxID=1965070 RepID=A0A3S3NXH3_9ACAR|nr:eukaryotic translation initiation factor 3 subunit J-like protein [Dinothrombium tinctorium]